MSLIVWAKVLELKTGKPQALAKLGALADPFIRRRIDTGRKIFGRAGAVNVRRFFLILSNTLFHLFGITGLFVSKHYGRYSSWVKGRKFLKGKGTVSFFLRNVSESKEEKKDSN